MGQTHPMAEFTMWGKSLARKRVFKLDAGYLKSNCNQTVQQPAAGQAGRSAEPEAVPFTKPKAKKAKLASRQQVKAAAVEVAKLQAARSSPRCQAPKASAVTAKLCS